MKIPKASELTPGIPILTIYDFKRHMPKAVHHSGLLGYRYLVRSA